MNVRKAAAILAFMLCVGGQVLHFDVQALRFCKVQAFRRTQVQYAASQKMTERDFV